ncbi:hypothetical protein ACFOG5_08990 [Pedobacter fastidiosus]|uniref:Uncharacterized protein n=1 Tax=Pedobacter fastidiosus TaxID=2765361 RepID=A0ABR7KU67_9SPHI|nr:hypothetical protein [Pedobacter fastidiosus]MBC6111307.1 hypothetical protein [Pedobacter fastidiosus]
MKYKGTTPRYYEAKEIFESKFTGIDTTTHGNWGKTYGKDGYILCNYEGNGIDKKSLPNYVSAINYYKVKGNNLPLNTVWNPATTSQNALAPDRRNGFPRTAACLFAMDADQIGNTFTTTIGIKGNQDYKVSLYFLDWDNKGRKISVELFDEKTSKLIAPVKIVESCSGGTYLTYAYNKSAKFRINLVRGDNPVLSGIFFDSDPIKKTRKD